MTATNHQRNDQIKIRLPDGMREEIRKAAAQNHRSMNAEIVARLAQVEADSGTRRLDLFAAHALTGILARGEDYDKAVRRAQEIAEDMTQTWLAPLEKITPVSHEVIVPLGRDDMGRLRKAILSQLSADRSKAQSA